MTREAFIDRHLDELIGLLLGAFAVQQEAARFADGPHAHERVEASKGRFMIGQMRKARTLLGRMYDELEQKSKDQPKPK